jgi:hypothetical protein
VTCGDSPRCAYQMSEPTAEDPTGRYRSPYRTGGRSHRYGTGSGSDPLYHYEGRRR